MSAPKDIVWREVAYPHQWIGMHLHHPGGIRCNSRRDAETFMRDLCGKRGCVWVRAYDAATAAPPTPKPHEDRDPAAGAARASEEGR